MKLKENRLIIVVFILLSFNINAQNNLVGSYYNSDLKRQFVLNSDGSFLILNSKNDVNFYQIDTLSYGTWQQEENFIILNTPKSIDSQKLGIAVIENELPNSDSLVIEISNPYEKQYGKIEKGFHRVFSYIFFIDSYQGNFGPEILMESNRIVLPKTKEDKLVNLNLSIIPNSYLYPSLIAYNFLTTDFYEFKNRNSNYIKIDIPDLTFNYIGYMRFRDEYIKIKNDVITIRGEKFKKSSR